MAQKDVVKFKISCQITPERARELGDSDGETTQEPGGAADRPVHSAGGGVSASTSSLTTCRSAIKNRRRRSQTLKAEYEKKSTELARANAPWPTCRDSKRNTRAPSRWSMAAELLPIDRQSRGLLRKITLAGQQTGVSFVLFRPGARKPDVLLRDAGRDRRCRGGYHQVGSFLAELANMRRIVTVANVKLTTSPMNDMESRPRLVQRLGVQPEQHPDSGPGPREG